MRRRSSTNVTWWCAAEDRPEWRRRSASARTGASTRLIETHGCLGGLWTSGLLCWVLQAQGKTGIVQEIMGRLEKRAAGRKARGNNFIRDPEAMKLLLEEMCREDGVEVQLHTRVVSAARNGGDRVSLAVTESKSGRQGWAGKVFVVATGDGDLSYHAGCGYEYGHEQTRAAQPMTDRLLCFQPSAVEAFSVAGGCILP